MRHGLRPPPPRMLIVKLQHANPYYDDSYAVNSANVGPYGDAIETELNSGHRASVFAALARAGPDSSTEARPAAGNLSPYRCSIRSTINGAFVACPDPGRFPRLHDG